MAHDVRLTGDPSSHPQVLLRGAAGHRILRLLPLRSGQNAAAGLRERPVPVLPGGACPACKKQILADPMVLRVQGTNDTSQPAPFEASTSYTVPQRNSNFIGWG